MTTVVRVSREMLVSIVPAGKTSFCLLECKGRCVLSKGLQGLISGREVISVLISVVHLELSLGFDIGVLTPLIPLAAGVGLFLPVAPKLLSGKG